MQKNRLSWMIGGPQGSGINASAEVFAKACSRAGLRVYANIEYHSNIMGKHSFYRVRVSDEDLRSYQEKVDILVALDLETLVGDGDHRRWPTHYGHLHEVNDALDAINGSRTTILPNALNLTRRILTARALTGLGRYDDALEMVGNDWVDHKVSGCV